MSQTTRQLLRYCLVGGANTATHFSVLTALVEWGHWRPLVANVLAFLVASSLSFQLNARYTFGRPPALRSYPPFLAVALLGLALSSAALRWAEHLGWHYLIGAGMGVVATVAVGFVLNKKLVFGAG